MNLDAQSFKRGAVKPMVCLREAWQLIKGDYWLFLGITLVGMIVGSLGPMGLLMGPAMCGIHYCLLRQEHGQRVSFDMLFRGFDYFVPSLVATLIMMVPMIVLILIAYLLFVVGTLGALAAMPRPAPGQGPDPEFLALFGGIVVLYILVITVISTAFNMLFFFVYPLIVDRGLSGVEAVKLSIRAAFGNFFGVLGVLILVQVLSLLGVLACYFGVILVLPVTFAMMSIAYQQVFQRDEIPADDDRELDAPPPVGPLDTGIQGAPSDGVAPSEPEGRDAT